LNLALLAWLTILRFHLSIYFSSQWGLPHFASFSRICLLQVPKGILEKDVSEIELVLTFNYRSCGPADGQFGLLDLDVVDIGFKKSDIVIMGIVTLILLFS
jgi:hypothetical protein